MTKKYSYKVGDELVEPGNIYKIFKISKSKGENGKTEKLAHFRPFFKETDSTGIVATIPVENIEKPAFRPLISSSALDECLKMLKTKTEIKKTTDIADLKDILKLNDLKEVVRVINTLLKEKNGSETFPKSKKDVIDVALTSIKLEFAAVKKVSLSKAELHLANFVTV